MQPVVEQIKRLAETQPDIAGFYRQSIEFIAEKIDAQALVAWDCNSVPYHTIGQYSRESSEPIRVGVSQQKHVELLRQAAERNSVFLSTPDSGHTNSEPGNSVILLCPVQRGTGMDLIEVFLKPGKPKSRYDECRDELQVYCNAMSETLATNTFANQPIGGGLSSSQSLPQTLQPVLSIERLDQFANNVHQSIDHRETCYNIANESQALMNCDRVSVVRFERKSKTIAISGLPKFNRRANAIGALERLATAVLKTGQPFWYPDTRTESLPQITEPLDRYLTEGVTRSLVVMPIREKNSDTRLSPEEIQFEASNPVIGGIVYESFSGQWEKERMSVPISLVSRHAESAYRNAFRHQGLFLYPLWRTLGKARSLTAPRYLSKTLLFSGLAIALLASLFLVPARMTVSGDGQLVPSVRRNIFVQIPGQVIDVEVQHGDLVESGTPLVTMISSELQIKLNDIDNRIGLAEQQIEALDTRRLAAVSDGQSSDDNSQSDLERTSLVKQLESFQNEKAIYEDQLDKLTVTSPIAGQVITTNLQQQLLDRPVKSGQILMSIADTGGEWIIEMDLPDRRIGHLQRARNQLGEALKVTFILAADPGRKLTGTVFDVGLATEVTQSSGQTIRVKIRLDDPGAVDIRQVGTNVAVKIDCGDCSLGYSVFRDLQEFFQSKVLFHFQ